MRFNTSLISTATVVILFMASTASAGNTEPLGPPVYYQDRLLNFWGTFDLPTLMVTKKVMLSDNADHLEGKVRTIKMIEKQGGRVKTTALDDVLITCVNQGSLQDKVLSDMYPMKIATSEMDVTPPAMGGTTLTMDGTVSKEDRITSAMDCYKKRGYFTFKAPRKNCYAHKSVCKWSFNEYVSKMYPQSTNYKYNGKMIGYTTISVIPIMNALRNHNAAYDFNANTVCLNNKGGLVLVRYDKLTSVQQLNNGNNQAHNAFSRPFSFLEAICQTHASSASSKRNCNTIVERYAARIKAASIRGQ
ncbi:hypothetical protein BDF22DRAFT_654935 [Syncephalis plumigaleata]|nr:hypothetical protein BDF22DRAFT_654935 [Syncephalis plumigaleata]